MKTMKEAFSHLLKDIYYAENALVRALPKASAAATNKHLKAALDAHLTETKGQIKTLESVFESIGEKPTGEKCDAIEGLIKETDGLIKEATGVALNASLLASAQAIEHYEIARYGTLREWAKVLGYDEAHAMLGSILDQEKAANSKLTAIAVSDINA